MSLHPDHALFVAREQHRQDLLAAARQERLADLACPSGSCQRPTVGLAAAVLALRRHLTAIAALALRARPASAPAATDPPAPSVAR